MPHDGPAAPGAHGHPNAPGEIIRADSGGRIAGPCLLRAEPSEADITRHLRRFGAAYPGFTFSYVALGRKGRRWTAERIDRSAPGLRVAITGDLIELHAALQRDKDGRS